MRILPAAREDLDELIAVQRRAFRTQAELYDDPNLPPLTETIEAVAASFDSVTILKAVDEDGRLVGSIRGRPDGDTVQVGRLSVDPDVQRRGVGRALIAALEARFPGRRFEMFTGDKSVGNLRLYESLGYVRFREERGDDGILLIYLEKRS